MADRPPEVGHRRTSRVARAPVIGLVAVVAVAGLVLGRNRAPAPAPQPLVPAGGALVAPVSALTSAWFCGGATDARNGGASGSVVIANVAPVERRATIDILSSRGPSRSLSVTVGADSRATVPETVPGGAPWVGATVDLDGGGVGVEQQITGPLGTAATPCATSGSPTWFFANAATLVNATSEITLLNPYPATATVDLSFTTNQGIEQPAAFQAIVVAPYSLVAVPIRNQLPRRSFIATTVATTSGRVVAWKTDMVTPPAKGAPILGTAAASRPFADPASANTGMTLTLGAPVASRTWLWPQGVTQPGLIDQYVVYDPGPRPAEVAVAVHLAQGSAEPIDLSVGAGEVTALDMGSEARIPSGVPYTVAVTSRNGVPVVAERVVTQSAPVRPDGIGEVFGSPHPARSWLIGAGTLSSRLDEQLVVGNPSGSTVRVTVEELTGGRRVVLAGLNGVRVGPGGQLLVALRRLGRSFDAPLLVVASGPVVAGRDLYGAGGAHGLGLSLGMPLAG